MPPLSPFSDAPRGVISVKPVRLEDRDRGTPLDVRVTAPVTGDRLPVLLFSHGFGWSMDGYAPLADHYAAHGFVVLQPTYLDSRRLGIWPDDPRAAGIWRRRVVDAHLLLDRIDVLLGAVPGLPERADAGRVVAVGHSFGAQTTSVLLGARVLGPDGSPSADLSDPRVQAGVLLTPAGLGGDALSPFAREHFPFMNPGFGTLTSPALVVVGDHDDSPLTVRGPEWMTDAFRHSPGAEALLTVIGGEHSLGGIPGYEVKETTDEDPDRVALVQRYTTAYLRSAVDADDDGWAQLQDAPDPRVRIHVK